MRLEGLREAPFFWTVKWGVRLSGVVGLFIIGLMALMWRGVPSTRELQRYEPHLSTRLLDRKGRLITELYFQKRAPVRLSQIPSALVQAILTIEDRRFYQHWGVDLIRVVKAAAVDVATLSLKEGASTLTQQLARDIYLHRRRTLGRKIKETLTAIKLERHFTKDEILEMYLTQIYFGHGMYGVRAASEFYFGKEPGELTLAQCALLAALPKAPHLYSPLQNPDLCLKRRNLILRLMYKRGLITQEAYHQATQEPLLPERPIHKWSPRLGAYFSEMVRQFLVREGSRVGFDYLNDGLTVTTTLDLDLQAIAEEAIEEHLGPYQSEYRRRFIERHRGEIEERLYGKGKRVLYSQLLADSLLIDSLFASRAVVQVALVALDPASGDILALVGGRDFRQSQFNRAVQAVRQPGSVFKPFAYVAAIDNGYSPAFEVLNQEVVVNMADGTRWIPQNYDGSIGGPTTLREALRRSLNLCTVRLTQEVVPPTMVVDYAHRLGITSHLNAVESIGLGSNSIIPLEATAAFSVFAAGGIYHKPRFIIKIADRTGKTLGHYPPHSQMVLTPQTAYIMTDMLADALDRGTGASARTLYNFTAPAAGKTGTTNDFTDAWFIGYTPYLVCGVWVGVDDPAESLGPRQSGAVAALPIWAIFMRRAYQELNLPPDSFLVPPGIVRIKICSETKLLATSGCPNVYEEVFRIDCRPLRRCNRHSMSSSSHSKG